MLSGWLLVRSTSTCDLILPALPLFFSILLFLEVSLGVCYCLMRCVWLIQHHQQTHSCKKVFIRIQALNCDENSAMLHALSIHVSGIKIVKWLRMLPIYQRYKTCVVFLVDGVRRSEVRVRDSGREWMQRLVWLFNESVNYLCVQNSLLRLLHCSEAVKMDFALPCGFPIA